MANWKETSSAGFKGICPCSISLSEESELLPKI